MTKYNHYNPYFIMALALIASCSPTPDAPPIPDPLDLNIVINERAQLLWYRDADLIDFIPPTSWADTTCPDPGPPCGQASSAIDYRCTILPDTMWGIIKRTYYTPETLACLSGTCRSRDTTYTLAAYLKNISCD